MTGDGKTKPTFIEGQRFQLSRLGAQRCPRNIVKVGQIVRIRKNTATVIVKFDGNKDRTTLHRDYIEPA